MRVGDVVAIRLADMARHFFGCHSIQGARVQNVEDDAAGNFRQALD